MEEGVGDGNMPSNDLLGKLKIRKDVSVASWETEKGLAEVIVRKGKLWCCMGVMRSSKLFCNVEEAVYLSGLGSLMLVDSHKVMKMDEIYSLLLIPAHGCSWAAYQTFAYLKRLGYIVGRHGIPWTTSRKRENLIPLVPAVSGDQPLNTEEQFGPQETESQWEDSHSPPFEITDYVGCKLDVKVTGDSSLLENHLKQGRGTYGNEAAVSVSEIGRQDYLSEETVDIQRPLSLLSLNKDEDPHASLPMYDVFLPNGRFKKSTPGLPAFRLCISSSQPPKFSEVRALELKSGEVPLKFAVVESGHVSIFSFDRVSLPELL